MRDKLFVQMVDFKKIVTSDILFKIGHLLFSKHFVCTIILIFIDFVWHISNGILLNNLLNESCFLFLGISWKQIKQIIEKTIN